MRLQASDLIIPLKHFLDRMFEDYGVYLFIGFAWLCLIAIAWVLSGGLRRRKGYDDSAVSVGLIIYPPNPPSDPPPLEPGIDLNPPHDFDRDCD
jgi:hypothetical protein